MVIGSYTAVELIENNYGVVTLGDLSNSTRETLDRIEKITGTWPTFVNVDLKDTEKTEKVISEHKDAKAVINLQLIKLWENLYKNQ